MRGRTFSPWWVFVVCAVVPVALVAVLAWRGRTAVMVEARDVERLRLVSAANAAERQVEERLVAARRILSAIPEGADLFVLATPPGMRAFVLDSAGVVVSPPLPKVDDEPSAECVTARADLLGPARAAARSKILTNCSKLRSESGRHLWPLLALEAPETAVGLPAWLEQDGALLEDVERETLLGRVSANDALAHGHSVELLASPSNDAIAIRRLLERREGETVEGSLRIRSGSYVAVMRTFDDRRTSGLVMVARSLLDAPPALPGDLALAVGRASTGNVMVTPSLVFHVAERDPQQAAARVARAGTTVVFLAGASVLAALALGALLYARLLRARKLAELRTDFVAAVSHELRTPLGSVLMLAELLEQRAVPDDERPEVEASLANEARRLSDTLARMLRFGALSRGKLNVTLAPASLASVAEAATERFARAHAGRSIEVDVDVKGEAHADAGLLGLAIDNLLGNAAKYAPLGDPYRLAMHVRGSSLVISVTDHGPGLAKEAAARVFLPFERADDRLTAAPSGTGIGLALVRGIAEAHGGTAHVESRPGNGATFIIEVPWKPC